MFGYYFSLALRSFKRNKALTFLMVLAIALGIGASMTTLTVFYVLSGDPIPQKSDMLFYVQMDPASMNGFTPGQDPEGQMTRFDSESLLREKRGDQQAMMSAGGLAIEPDKAGMTPFTLQSRYTSADFFSTRFRCHSHASAISGFSPTASAFVTSRSSAISRISRTLPAFWTNWVSDVPMNALTTSTGSISRSFPRCSSGPEP